jgi:DNA-directed RNA polymerase subunit RPC12/RpoP
MFSCERCGSQYSAMHAVAIENCPRCQIRERVTSPLTFKPFGFSEREGKEKIGEVGLEPAAKTEPSPALH